MKITRLKTLRYENVNIWRLKNQDMQMWWYEDIKDMKWIKIDMEKENVIFFIFYIHKKQMSNSQILKNKAFWKA